MLSGSIPGFDATLRAVDGWSTSDGAEATSREQGAPEAESASSVLGDECVEAGATRPVC